MTDPCSVCGVDPVSARGRCPTCYRYRVRTGRDRNPALISAWADRRLERHMIGRLLGGITRW